MSELVEPLDWDSEFFGFPIGKVSLDGATEDTLRAVDDEARALGLACLYGSLDPAEETTAYLAQAAGHRLVEVAILFSRRPGPFEAPPTDARVRRGTVDDLAALEPAMRTMATFSRYATDPRFGDEAAARMHGAWMARAARDTEDRRLFLAEDDSGITGVSTCVAAGGVHRVDTTGVTKPGTGAADALMAALFAWAENGATEAGPCAARNVPVLRYVERCGFRASQTRYLFHRWLDDHTSFKPGS